MGVVDCASGTCKHVPMAKKKPINERRIPLYVRILPSISKRLLTAAEKRSKKRGGDGASQSRIVEEMLDEWLPIK